MGYDRGDSFPFVFEPNGVPFGSENRKENCHHDHIPFNEKGNRILVFSVLFFSDLGNGKAGELFVGSFVRCTL